MNDSIDSNGQVLGFSTYCNENTEKINEEHFKDIDMQQLLLCNPSFKMLSQAGRNSHAKYKQKKTQHTSAPMIDPVRSIPFPLTTKYNSLTNWKSNQHDVKIKEAYLRVIKFILLREESLIKLNGLCEKLDTYYWKYAHTRGKFAA